MRWRAATATWRPCGAGAGMCSVRTRCGCARVRSGLPSRAARWSRSRSERSGSRFGERLLQKPFATRAQSAAADALVAGAAYADFLGPFDVLARDENRGLHGARAFRALWHRVGLDRAQLEVEHAVDRCLVLVLGHQPYVKRPLSQGQARHPDDRTVRGALDLHRGDLIDKCAFIDNLAVAAKDAVLALGDQGISVLCCGRGRGPAS